jgi:hypothetical protein
MPVLEATNDDFTFASRIGETCVMRPPSPLPSGPIQSPTTCKSQFYTGSAGISAVPTTLLYTECRYPLLRPPPLQLLTWDARLCLLYLPGAGALMQQGDAPGGAGGEGRTASDVIPWSRWREIYYKY